MAKYGFVPIKQVEKIYALQVALTAADTWSEWYNKKNKAVGFGKWITNRIGNFLAVLENQLKRNNDGKGWFFGDKPTIADVFVADFMRRYKFSKSDHYETCKFSVLKEHCKRFEEFPQINKYIESEEYKKVCGQSGFLAL
eukprot:UN01917